MSKATIIDISKKTGFSKSTVSYALNNKPGVGKKAREEIIKVAKDMGYTPNVFARRISNGVNRTIGIILRDLSNPFYTNVFCAIDKTAEKHGYQTVFFNLNSDPSRIKNGIQLMKGNMVSGIVLDFFSSDEELLDDLRKSNIPVVIFGKEVHDDFSSVQTNDSKGAAEAVEHAVAMGHRNIYYVTRKEDVFSQKRLKVIRKTARDLGLEFDDSHYVRIKNGGDLGDCITRQCPKDSVIICYNDILAFSIISALSSKGIYVPQDYSFIGFDNLSIVPYPLTSVDIPKYEMAETATKILIRQIENKDMVHKVTLSSGLVIKGSVKNLNGN